MFQVHATTLDAYLNFDPERRPDLVKLSTLIREAAPNLRRYFHKGTPAGHPGMRMSMIGHGKFSYTARSGGESVSWPVVGVALQLRYISVYVSTTRDGLPIVHAYKGALGESRVGRNNFSFERFDSLNAERVFELFAEVGRIYRADPQNPVRYKQS